MFSPFHSQKPKKTTTLLVLFLNPKYLLRRGGRPPKTTPAYTFSGGVEGPLGKGTPPLTPKRQLRVHRVPAFAPEPGRRPAFAALLVLGFGEGAGHVVDELRWMKPMFWGVFCGSFWIENPRLFVSFFGINMLFVSFFGVKTPGFGVTCLE